MSTKLRKLSLVTMKKKWADDPSAKKQPFFKDMPLVFLGEILGMPEHGVFVGHRSGRVYSGFHTFQFRELRAHEI
jgi:hypothetical protein